MVDSNKKDKGERKLSCIQETNLMLEEMLKEPNIDGKIEELEKALEEARAAEEKAIEKSETLKPTQRKTTPEREAAKSQRDEKKDQKTLERDQARREARDKKAQEAIDKKKADLREEAARPRREIERKLSFYKAFKEHKNEILNLRDYQLVLQGKLDQLEAKKQEIDSKLEKANSLSQESEDIYNQMKELLEKRHELEKRLMDPNLPDSERQQINNEIRGTTSDILSAEAKRSTLAFRSNEMRIDSEGSKKTSDKIAAEIAKTKIAITKTSLVWRNLLKGRNWDEIETTLSGLKFTGVKGTVDRIEELGDIARGQEGRQREGQISTQGQVPPTQGQQRASNQGTAKQTDNEKEPTPPAEYKSYKEEHRILGRIPFWGKYKEQQRQQEYDQMKSEYEEAKARYEQNQEEKRKEEEQEGKDLTYLTKRLAREDRTGKEAKQIDVLKSIAQNGRQGIRETVRVDQETQRRLQKVAAAHAEAEKFGGKYAEQETDELKHAGIEPGDD